jgi:rare lipoprotein A
MFLRLLTAGVAAFGLALAPIAEAQEASKPAAASAAASALQAMPTMASTAHAFEGKVSYYGPEFAGRKTSSGESVDPSAFTMAHKTLPFGSMVRVTNLQNNKSVVVRVNDRGPHTAGRVGDLSAGAAQEIGMLRSGVVAARLEVVSMAAVKKMP